MFDLNKKGKKFFDDDDDDSFESVSEDWASDEDDKEDDPLITDDEDPEELIRFAVKEARKEGKRVARRVTRAARAIRTPRTPRAPPLPPVPPLPPLPPEIEILKSDKVIGIRGLDTRLYKDLSKIARKNGLSVADLINRLFAKYRYDSVGENGNTISNVSSLELNEEELVTLDDEIINIVGVKNLLLSPDITPETFQKIKRVENVERIWVPSHLYLLLLKKVKNCYKIEKFKGDRLPQVVQKSFDSDVHLTSSFFDYFLETDQQVDLRVYGELRIDTDVSLDDFRQVIYNLAVDGDIHAPKHLIGLLFATVKCYGEIEATND
ncbi:hypothetical protein CEE45_08680 [Candidatus Heimdallarchaeota archaeon B3_Heim]|nr:MAG: hypothetical protein CEE45_08680 [Candidatus Heimdallarchaeota archaeon B3_Heim]